MKFLLDENISRRIIPLIKNEFPVVMDLFSYEGQSKFPISDHSVWRLAKENAAHIITRDDDFLKLSMLFGFPPKVICLQVGNVRNTIQSWQKYFWRMPKKLDSLLKIKI